MKTRMLWIGAVLLAATACGSGSSDPAADARDALNKGDFAAARSICEQALADKAVLADAKTAAALNLVHTKALASLGDAEATKGALAALSGASATTALYVDAAGRLKKAGQLLGAIEVADAGIKRFPDDKANFKGLIEALKESSAGDDAATEKLRSLGYL